MPSPTLAPPRSRQSKRRRRSPPGPRSVDETARRTDPTAPAAEDRAHVLGSAIGAVVSIASLPFRLLVRIFDWAGRLASMLLGFLLMVAGVALCAGPLALVGVPMFLFGLYLTLRALG